MHEYSIAYDIVVTAKRAALENNAEYINAVYVNVGKLSIVNPEQVEFLFKAIIEDDPLFRETKLICTVVDPLTRCACGYEGNEIYVCPECGQLPVIERGREVVVTRIEVEAS